MILNEAFTLSLKQYSMCVSSAVNLISMGEILRRARVCFYCLQILLLVPFLLVRLEDFRLVKPSHESPVSVCGFAVSAYILLVFKCR